MMKATHYVRNVVNINSNTEKTVEKELRFKAKEQTQRKS